MINDKKDKKQLSRFAGVYEIVGHELVTEEEKARLKRIGEKMRRSQE